MRATKQASHLFAIDHPASQETGICLSSGAPRQIPSRNRTIPNFSGYKAASFARNPGKFTEFVDSEQGDFACQQGEKGVVLATFSVQIARFSRESRFFARKSGLVPGSRSYFYPTRGVPSTLRPFTRWRPALVLEETRSGGLLVRGAGQSRLGAPGRGGRWVAGSAGARRSGGGWV